MKTVIPIDIVTLGEDNSYHLFVNGFIDGIEYDLLIDTGASQTVFDSAVVPEIANEKAQEIQSSGIHAGELKSSIGQIKKFRLGNLKRKKWKVILIDLSHVNSLYERFSSKKVAGLIGSDFLLHHKAVIDYKRKELVLRNIRQKK